MKIKNFSWFCQHSLPAVYTDALSYYEVLCKVITKLNETIDGCNLALEQAETVEELSSKVNELYNNLESNVQASVNKLFEDGVFDEYISNTVTALVNEQVSGMISETVTKHNDLSYTSGTIEFGSNANNDWRGDTCPTTVVFDKGIYTITVNGKYMLPDAYDIPDIRFTGINEGSLYYVTGYRIETLYGNINEIAIAPILQMGNNKVISTGWNTSNQGNPDARYQYIFKVYVRR